MRPATSPWALFILAIAGCTPAELPTDADAADGGIVDGGAPDADAGPARHPGPCTGRSDTTTCRYRYDRADRLVELSCDTPAIGYTYGWTRTFDGERLTLWRGRGSDGGGATSFTWELGETEVTETWSSSFFDSLSSVQRTASYDPNGFAFTGSIFDPGNPPDAPDALVRSRVVTERSDPDPPIMEVVEATYSYDGVPRTGTRVRTGSDGSVRSFTYDDRARLVRDSAGPLYQYDGDRLVRSGDGRTTYSYDAAGNLISLIGPDATGLRDATMAFEYGCWEPRVPIVCNDGETDCSGDIVRECRSVDLRADWVEIGERCGPSTETCWRNDRGLLLVDACTSAGACEVRQPTATCDGACVEGTTCVLRHTITRLQNSCGSAASRRCTGEVSDIIADETGVPWWTGSAYGGYTLPSGAAPRAAFVHRGDQFATWGEEGQTEGAAVARTAAGAVVTGSTDQSLAGAAAGGLDAFVRAFSDDLAAVATTQWGTAGDDRARAVAVGSGYALVAGETDGSFGPDPDLDGVDVFVTRIDGASVTWTRQWGSARDDRVSSIVLDALGGGFVSGTRGAVGGDAEEVFVTRFGPDGGATWTSTRPGGSSARAPLALDGAGGVYVALASGAGAARIEHLSASGGWLDTLPLSADVTEVFDLVTTAGGALLVSGLAAPGGVFYVVVEVDGSTRDAYGWTFGSAIREEWTSEYFSRIVDTAVSLTPATIFVAAEHDQRSEYTAPFVVTLPR